LTNRLADALNELAKEFVRQIPARMSLIRRIANTLESSEWNEATLRELRRLAHSLTGAAGTFNQPALASAARNLETLAGALVERPGDARPTDYPKVKLAIRDIEMIAKEIGDSGNDRGFAPSSRRVPAAAAHQDLRPSVQIVEDDPVQAEHFRAVVEEAGYRAEVYLRTADFRAAGAATARPAAVIMDLVLDGKDDAGARLVDELRFDRLLGVPTLFVSVRDDVTSRLAAARAGAERYLTKPITADELKRELARVIRAGAERPLSVLLVDDDADQVAAHAAMLRARGIETRIATEPLAALGILDEMQPDTLVLDVYMPNCTGPELASMVRDQDAYAHLPIIFLSSETNFGAQMAALGLGGDDFLVKPVDPLHFGTAIEVRARRSRRMRRLLEALRGTLYERQRESLAVDQHAIISVADRAGNILYVNQKFCEISQYTRAEAVGQNHRIVKSGLHDPAFYKDMWATISRGDIWHGAICNRRKDGQLYWVQSTIVPFLDEDKRPYRYVSIRTDITVQHNAEQKARQTAELLRLSQAHANIGTWERNFLTDELIWSETVAPLLGCPNGMIESTLENFYAAVHPDDRERLREGVRACVEDGIKYDAEHRCIWPDGSVRWLHQRADVVRDAQGKPVRLIGVVQDITARKALERSLDQQRSFLDALRAAQVSYMLGKGIEEPSAILLDGMMAMTGSLYGFIGSAAETADGSIAVTVGAAITALDDPESQAACRALRGRTIALTDRRTPIGVALDTLKPALVGASDPPVSKCGLMDRHPEFRTFLAVPVLNDGKLAGVYALAGSAQDYGSDAVSRLDPVGVSYGAMLAGEALRRSEALAMAEAARARDEAEKASLAKSEFLSNISHELRTPLNSILGFSQLLADDGALDADQRDSASTIHHSGKHLLALINDILDLTKVEAGRLELSVEAVDVGEIVEDCCHLIRALAAKRNIEVHLRVPQSLVLLADRIRLKQILINYLSNAVKYNRADGRVDIEATRTMPGRIRIHVRDTGQGIAAERMAELYKPFNRLGAESSGVEGTGIGLALTRRLAEIMGGAVGVTSEVGRGSDFWIELPEVDGAATPLIRVEHGPAGRPSGSAPSRTAVYIEDNPSNILLMEHIFARLPGVRLIAADEASLGYDLICRHRPDLVLLDINMPELDGYDVLRLIRRNTATKGVPVIALTAAAMPLDVKRGLDAGFDAYITKPLDIEKLLNMIREFLKRGARPTERAASSQAIGD
jgi:PAS domain S-box-containing protein